MSGTTESRSPGEVIAAARRQRSLSLEDLAERTKIPTAMLAAIEADEYHRLSGPLYARSFLRSCAKELGLSADEVLDLYARHSGETPRAAGAPVNPPETVRIQRVGLPWWRLGAGAAGLVAVAALAFVLTRPGPEPVVTRAGGGGTAANEAGLAGAPGWADPNAAPTTGDVPPATEAVPSVTGEAPAGVPGLGFSDGLTWPVVVRLRVPAPLPVRARRDADEQFAEVAWPAGGTAAPVPVAGIEAGRAYATGEGLVVYWGAVGRLSLVLGAVEGVEVTVNGEPRALSPAAAGGEIVLDLQAAAPAPLP